MPSLYSRSSSSSASRSSSSSAVRMNWLHLCQWAIAGLVAFSGVPLMRGEEMRGEEMRQRTVTEDISLPDATLDSVVSQLAKATGASLHTILGAECAAVRRDFTLRDNATLDEAFDILRDRVVGLRVLQTPRGFVLVDAHGLRGVEWVHASRPAGTSFTGLLDDLVEETVNPPGWMYFPPTLPDERLASFQKRRVRIECGQELSASQVIALAAEEAGVQLRVRIDPTPQELSWVFYEDTPPPLSRISHVRPMHIEGVVSWSTEWAPARAD